MLKLTNAIFISKKRFEGKNGTSWAVKLAGDQGELQFWTNIDFDFPMARFDLACNVQFSMNGFQTNMNCSDFVVGK